MKGIILVITCAVLLSSALVSAHHECGSLQRLKVKRQWAASYGQGRQRAELGHFIWAHTFHHSKAARELFSDVRGDNIHSNAFRAHAERVLSSLDMCIALLDDEPTLSAALAHLAGQHTNRNVLPEYWQAFTHSVLRGIEHEVGPLVFDKDSWDPCMQVIAKGIQGS